MIQVFCVDKTYDKLQKYTQEHIDITKTFFNNKKNFAIDNVTNLFNQEQSMQTWVGNIFILLLLLFNYVLMNISIEGKGSNNRYANIYGLLVQCVYQTEDSKHYVIIEWILYMIFFVVINVILTLFLEDVYERIDAIAQWNQHPPITEVKHSYDTLQNLHDYFTHTLIMPDNLKKNLLRATSDMFSSRIHKYRYTMLLTGLPGVGKTEAAKKILAYNGGGYIVKLSNLIRLGPNMIHNIFQDLFYQMKVKKKTVLFDDGELGLLDRMTIHNNNNAGDEFKENNQLSKSVQVIVTNLLSMLGDGEYYVIFTTNISKGESFDQAYSRRFSKLLHFETPDVNIRKRIVRKLLKYRSNINRKFRLYGDQFFNTIVSKLENCSGRDMENLFNYMENIESNFHGLSNGEILDIINHHVQVNIKRVANDIENIHNTWRLNNTIDFNVEGL